MTPTTPRNRYRVVDLFAGGGGFSTAAKMAGCDVVAAVNHDPEVVAVHAANHPETVHGCYSLNPDTDYTKLPEHDILVASPCCHGHSDARGKDRPEHDASRATLLAVLSAVHAKRPPVVIVENVPEVKRWGRDGDGSRYAWWKAGFEVEGYRVTENILEAADFGTPSRRERMFVLMVHESVSDRPVAVAAPGTARVPARDVIDRSPTHEKKMKPIADKCKRTREKIEKLRAGKMKGVHEWVFCYRGRGYGYGLDETICTITTHAHWCYVRGDDMRFLTPDELRAAMGFPAGYKMPKKVKTAIKFLGNAVAPPVAAAVVRAGMAVLDAAAARVAGTARPAATADEPALAA